MNRFDITRGQPRAWSILARAQAGNRVASTYLCYGPDGMGAWSLAIEFAALLNCESPGLSTDQPVIGRPCGDCRACRTILGLNFEGLHLIVPIRSHKNQNEAIDLTNEVLEQKRSEPFSLLDRSVPISIPIDLARETKRRLSLRPPAGCTRVVLFYQMETMRASSADALLKLIEEPPANTVIILTATRPEALSPTIQSRAQKIKLDRLPEQMVIDYLEQQYRASATAARLATRVCDRSLGQAITMVVNGATGETDHRSVGLMLFKALMTEPTTALVSRMVDLLNFRDRGAAEELVWLWRSLIRDGAYFANTSDESDLVNVDFSYEIKEIAPRLADPAVVERMVTTTKNTLADLKLNVHIQPALVAMALELKMDMKAGG